MELDLQLAAVVDAIGEAIIVTDRAGTVRYWNPSATVVYGWSEQEAVGRDLRSLALTDLTPLQAAELAERRDRGDAWSGELMVRHRGGNLFPALVTSTPLVDDAGEVVGHVGVCVDITELRDVRAHAQTRASQQAAVAALARAALAGTSLNELFDRAVRVVAAELDAPLCKVLELRPTNDSFLMLAGVGWHPGLVGAATVPNETASQAGYTMLIDGALVVPDLAGETRFEGPDLLVDHGVVSGMSTVIRGRGQIFGVLGVHTTSPRTFTEDDAAFLESVAGVLGGTIARDQVEAELRGTVEELARSDEIRVAFLRATSHELRTPLSALEGFAETLQRYDDRLAPGERRQLLDRLVANSRRLSGLIADLLDVDRLTEGLMTANRQPHDVRGLILRVLAETETDGIGIELDLDPIVARIDAPKIERVVANLARNAIRHTRPGATVAIRLQRQAADVVLHVDDDGEGIAPGYHDRIFEPFVQGPERHDDAKPGAGLGLTLVREFVELHDGEVAARDRPEGGARFEVRLPGCALPDVPVAETVDAEADEPTSPG
jgi:PAS domain S-box-containing protein